MPHKQPIQLSPEGRGGASAVRGLCLAVSGAAPLAPLCFSAPRAPATAACSLRLTRPPRPPSADMAPGANSTAVKIGVIRGTGLDDSEILEGRTEKYVDTPFGKVNLQHGRQHSIMPSEVNYRANIWALKEEGCTHVIVTTACGSLREEIRPGDIVIIDQFIDSTYPCWTTARSFWGPLEARTRVLLRGWQLRHRSRFP
ncbi:S-methyl-5'-thioadenosine phosphorylase-like isoform X1 [Equus asinus]|uniref:S-methyl-5'-thioadenosine phosphorylase-like isoform X1 n=1 Tax=Equus asinus TaxID=9793 RepID=UPI0038F70CC0